jgi:hypothetical protein
LAFSNIAITAGDFDTDAAHFDKINVDKFLEGDHRSLSRIPSHPPHSLPSSSERFDEQANSPLDLIPLGSPLNFEGGARTATSSTPWFPEITMRGMRHHAKASSPPLLLAASLEVIDAPYLLFYIPLQGDFHGRWMSKHRSIFVQHLISLGLNCGLNSASSMNRSFQDLVNMFDSGNVSMQKLRLFVQSHVLMAQKGHKAGPLMIENASEMANIVDLDLDLARLGIVDKSPELDATRDLASSKDVPDFESLEVKNKEAEQRYWGSDVVIERAPEEFRTLLSDNNPVLCRVVENGILYTHLNQCAETMFGRSGQQVSPLPNIF